MKACCVYRVLSLFAIVINLGWSIQGKLQYPPVRRDDSVVDNYHGTSVRDPYRYLEDPDSAETRDFVRRQNELTEGFLSAIPDRERIEEKLKNLWNFPRYFQEFAKEGEKYYFTMNSGLQNQPVVYVQDTLEDEPRVFFDPNQLSQDGSVTLRDYYFSRNGKIFAYCLSENGEDWKSCHFMEAETKKPLPDKLEGLKFSSLEWTHDNAGFFYSAFPIDPMTQERRLDLQQGCYHRLGTKQSDDITILSYPNEPTWFIDLQVTHDGKYLLARVSADFKANMVYLTSLERGVHPAMLWMPVVSNITEARYAYVANEGSIFYFRTDKKAPKFQIIQLETDRLKNPRFGWNKAVVPEHENNTLYVARAVANNKLFLIYIEDLKHKLEVRNLKDGALVTEIPLDLGSVWSASVNVRFRNELFFLFESFTIPSRIYRCTFDTADAECQIVRETKVKNLDTSSLETQLVFYQSKDETTIPMFIVHKKDIDRNGSTPVLLEGYGGFNTNTQPGFQIQNLIFVKYFDGIYATPGLRGGGDYGESWHEAGSLLNKHNVFDDFQSAAEYLVSEKYTQPSKIVITGSSNGGLLVGACVNRRPDLYGVAIPKVGVMDMIRYSKLGVGFWWVEEYGSPEVQEHFRNLYSYSPLHNIQKYLKETFQYPAMLILTGDHDDRVVPAHSYKYTAELQYRIGTLPQQMNPLLLKVETNVGHGLSRTPEKEVQEYTDIFAFISKTLNVEFSYNTGASSGRIQFLLMSLPMAISLSYSL